MSAQLIQDRLSAIPSNMRRDDVNEEISQDPVVATGFLPSPEAMEREIADVMTIKLSDDMQPWVEGYAKVGHRNPFLWNWCRRGVEVTMLSCVDPALSDAVCNTRVLGIMLDVLLDDIADHHKDLAFLEQLAGHPGNGHRAFRKRSSNRSNAPTRGLPSRSGTKFSGGLATFRVMRNSPSCCGSITDSSSTSCAIRGS